MTSPAVSTPAALSNVRSRTFSDGLKASMPTMPRRRSSVLSYASLASMDETRPGVASSAGDFIRPALGLDDGERVGHSPSHWHSSPLAFAILPAVGGLFFTNGSAFITDVLLLGLAAIFLNWSVTLPWDWYHAAQAVQQLQTRRSSVLLDDMGEEHSSDNNAPSLHDSVHSQQASAAQKNGDRSTTEQRDEEQELAAQELRTRETMTFLSTFLFPLFGAYLLHVIRGQLSRPSTGLVSDYNLSIFLLAAEIRPFKQLIRLVTNRTLHLQRIATAQDDPATATRSGLPLSDLSARLSALESKVAEQTSRSPAAATTQQQDMTALSTEMKKRYEPRLDALERAVRRYEKRATTLTLLTEQRLQSLESRLQDALSLAAVAAQSSQKPGIVVTLLGWTSTAMMVPLEALWLLFAWPVRLGEGVVRMIGELLLGPSDKRKRKVEQRPSRTTAERKKDQAYFNYKR